MTPETQVKKDIKAFLDSLGHKCWYFMPVPSGYGRKGIPDFIGCYNGYFFSIEAKAEGKKDNTTPWQDRETADIKAAYGVAIIADSVDWVKQRFEQYLKWTSSAIQPKH